MYFCRSLIQDVKISKCFSVVCLICSFCNICTSIYVTLLDTVSMVKRVWAEMSFFANYVKKLFHSPISILLKFSENIFFCPEPNGNWGVIATNKFSDNFRLFKMSLRKADSFVEIPAAAKGNNLFPAVDPTSKKLLFASDRDGVWRIYLLDLEGGSEAKALTSPDADCLSPCWCPRCKEERIAFSRFNEREGRWEICVMDLGSGRISYLGPGLFPAWSPDGRYLAVQRPREKAEGQFGIWIIDVTGKEGDRPVVVDERYAACNPYWSPDGKSLVFNTVKGGAKPLREEGGCIYIYHFDEGPGRIEGPLPGTEQGAWRPVWGKDGRIYFHKREGRAVNLFAVCRSDSRVSTLAERSN